jgi:hypothetical protein
MKKARRSVSQQIYLLDDQIRQVLDDFDLQVDWDSVQDSKESKRAIVKLESAKRLITEAITIFERASSDD